MRTILILAAAGLALALTGCDEPYREEAETVPAETEAPVAPAATDQTAPVVDAAAPDETATTVPPPPEEPTSEQSVQPESETLFY
ncbi:hypothetical protein BZG35_13265 [Brevundimonas sp. LM2]|uniref:hypothetical protein n=1 Tax=Brevundimonas sp. LM2 TaxID=1938605 RepID=UPI00098396E8|nr:hypothetical protein [Brevundimonas sp. LM2]AQR62506.1 hypothetical protein BZG35_13265 [Brevundimonas sp. LM2]